MGAAIEDAEEKVGNEITLMGGLAVGGEVGVQNPGLSVPGRFGAHIWVLSELHVAQRGGCPALGHPVVAPALPPVRM